MKVLHTRGREAGGRATRKATAFHGSVSAAITNTEHTPDTVTGGSAAAPFLRGERRGGGHTFSVRSPARCASIVAEDGNKSRLGQTHCTVTYFIVLFLEGNWKKRINASCFLSVFCSFEQIALAMFLHTVKWNYCLILFFFCYLILKIYLHKASLCNPLLLQMPLFFCCY